MNKTGGPAFPGILEEDILSGYDHGVGIVNTVKKHLSGMTLRDYFAAKAMQSYLSNPYCNGHLQPNCTAPEDIISEWAYKQADAMLREREKEGGEG